MRFRSSTSFRDRSPPTLQCGGQCYAHAHGFVPYQARFKLLVLTSWHAERDLLLIHASLKFGKFGS